MLAIPNRNNRMRLHEDEIEEIETNSDITAMIKILTIIQGIRELDIARRNQQKQLEEAKRELRLRIEKIE